MKTLFAVSCVVLSACSSPPISDPFMVKIPVAVACNIHEVHEPVWNVAALSRSATPPEKLKAVLSDLELSRGYMEELRAELQACS